MPDKIPWTLIDPRLYGLQYLNENDIIYFHLEYTQGGYDQSPANQWVFNYKKPIEHRGKSQWYYKEEAIKKFADLIIQTSINGNVILLAGPPSKHPNSELFDSRNVDVLKIVHTNTGIPVSFNLKAIDDFIPTHVKSGYRHPDLLKGRYCFEPFENVPDIVYIVDDVITSGSHFVVWRDLIHQVHHEVEVRGFYLARRVNPEYA
ncbi:MAG: hypothetical protein FWG77_04745 [Treponema sp.]|nr:hypothetical protein [Treponema sp.]